MLTHLSVRDLAVVDSVSVEFAGGLTVLTGETGAGKSILIDALSLVLGSRSNAQMVRDGRDRAEVTALFEVASDSQAAERLRSLELDDADGELHLRRTLSADGRSRAYVNGSPVPITTLRGLGRCLIEIHGQHEHQSLMDSAVQRDVLDAFGEHDTLLAKVGNAFHALRALQTELSELSGGHDDQSAHRALLTYQISELTELSPQPGEFEASRLELGRLSRVEEHRANALAALTNLEDNEGGAETALQRALGLVRDMAELDDSLGSCVELLESAAIHMDEAKTVLREFSERQSADPARLAALDERLDALQNVARKHHVDADELAPLQSRLETELATLEGAEQRLSQLDEELTAARKRYDKAAQALTKSRRIAATAMSDAVTANMHELGMPNGRCVLDISPQDDDTPRHHGADRVSIQIATNPGAQPQPLAKVASGGELSRVSLAVQVVLAAADSSTGALVFDEVDVGVGGGVAEIVGKRLRSVASTRQVLCVTHLPQVACQGHQHIRVAKTVDEGTARTQLEPLGQKTKVDEIARMLGGVEVTKRTLAHAREMLNLAHN